MKHTKFKINKLTTAAWTKAENHKTSKKGFMWVGSGGVDHVAREVLQHGVANRGSPRIGNRKGCRTALVLGERYLMLYTVRPVGIFRIMGRISPLLGHYLLKTKY